ncbi:MAG: hypothetical protein AB1657_05850 [Candidatus Micrarchaeota archaeon]
MKNGGTTERAKTESAGSQRPRSNAFRLLEGFALDFALDRAGHERIYELERELSTAKLAIRALTTDDLREKLECFGKLLASQGRHLDYKVGVEVFERGDGQEKIGIIELWNYAYRYRWSPIPSGADIYFYGMKEGDGKPRYLGEVHQPYPHDGQCGRVFSEYRVGDDSIVFTMVYDQTKDPATGNYKTAERRELGRLELKI